MSQTPARAIGTLPLVQRWIVLSLLVVAHFGLSSYTLVFQLSDGFAVWWPAAALGAFIVLAAGRGQGLAAALVGVTTALASLGTDRPIELGIALGVMNAVEALVVAVVVRRLSGTHDRDGQSAAWGFIVAAMSGAVVAGVLGGLAVWLLSDAPFFDRALQLTASHGAALLVLLPLGLVRWQVAPETPKLELALQCVVHVGLFALLYTPSQPQPLDFLLLLSLLWAALRFSIVVPVVQMALTGIAVVIATATGHGPFSVIFLDDPAAGVRLAQAWLAVHAGAVVILGGSRNDWRAASTTVVARERDLRRGISSTEIGLLIVERRRGAKLRVIAVNAVALAALQVHGSPDRWAGRRLDRTEEADLFATADLHDFVARHESGRFDLVSNDRSFVVEVAVADADADGGVITITFTDTTAQERREREAFENLRQLEELNAQKDSFISAVSHELRTPVTSILGFSELLEDAELSADDRQAIEVIGRNARRLSAVIEDVLELSQLSAIGGAPARVEEVDLVEQARHCASEMSGFAAQGGVSIVVEADEPELRIHSIERDLARVCSNLVSNAIKFSAGAERVTLKLSVAPPESGFAAEVRVIDEGLGVPEAYREMVWDRFSRVPTEDHRRVPGTGLGLPIVRALIEQRLGGTVDFEDAAQGTTVVVRLPERPRASLLD